MKNEIGQLRVCEGGNKNCTNYVRLDHGLNTCSAGVKQLGAALLFVCN